jgi:hypothetical protein
MYKLLRSVSVFWLLCLSASAQTTSPSSPPPPSDPQAVALIQKALAALTGGALITDVTLTGSARRIAGSDDQTGTATLTATSAGDSKVSLNLPSGVRTEIRNHSAVPLPGALPAGAPAGAAQGAQRVGAWSGADGALHPIVSHNLLADPSWFFPGFTLQNLASGSYILSYGGQESLNGNSVLQISAVQQFPTAPAGVAASLRHLSQIDLYLDSATWLPLVLVFDTHPDTNAQDDIPTQILFSNYQAIGGAKVPLHIQKYVNGGLSLDLQLTNAILNSGLATSAFQIQ